jgi:hypothetical protein
MIVHRIGDLREINQKKKDAVSIAMQSVLRALSLTGFSSEPLWMPLNARALDSLDQPGLVRSCLLPVFVNRGDDGAAKK